MLKFAVTDTHVDHYLSLKAADTKSAAWWDGFTGLTIVVSQLGLLTGALGATHLVAVVDRHSIQTFAWAFHAQESVDYIMEKIPKKIFHKAWRIRLAQSIQLALELHEETVAPVKA